MRDHFAAVQCFLWRPLRRDSGATAVEYGFLVFLIALVIVFAVTALGQHVATIFTQVDAGIP